MESFAFRTFQRKSATVAINDVDDQLGVLPVGVLRGTHVEGDATDIAEVDVASADGQFTGQITIGCTVVTAAA